MNFSDPERNVSQLNLKVGDIALDLGTGMGHYALAMAKVVDVSGRVIAVDIQKDLIKELTSRAKDQGFANIVPIVADIERDRGTGLESETVDVVVIANALFQVEDPFAFLKEAARVLKYDGRLLVVDWKESFGGIGPSEKYIISEDSLLETAEELGFRLDQKIDAGRYHYGLVLKKVG